MTGHPLCFPALTWMEWFRHVASEHRVVSYGATFGLLLLLLVLCLVLLLKKKKTKQKFVVNDEYCKHPVYWGFPKRFLTHNIPCNIQLISPHNTLAPHFLTQPITQRMTKHCVEFLREHRGDIVTSLVCLILCSFGLKLRKTVMMSFRIGYPTIKL